MNTIEAVCEGGIFRPLVPPELFDGQHVRILLEAPGEKDADDMLELAAQVYDGLSAQDVDETEDIAFSRKNFFREREC